MPYRTVGDLPAAQVARYSPHQRQAFLDAFNRSYAEYGEPVAFRIAHAAAQRAGRGMKRQQHQQQHQQQHGKKDHMKPEHPPR